MFVFELVGENEADSTYQKLGIDNLARQDGVPESMIETAMALNRPMLSLELIQALNYHAIACLHAPASQLSRARSGWGNTSRRPSIACRR